MKRSGSWHIAVVCGLAALSFFLLGAGDSSRSPSCPPLPEQGPASKISVYTAKVLDIPRIVCVRVYNGSSTELTYEGIPIRLQKRFLGLWFPYLTFKDISRSGRWVGISLEQGFLPIEGVIDRRLPGFYQPASAGRYRACFYYHLYQQNDWQETCSEEFSLP